MLSQALCALALVMSVNDDLPEVRLDGDHLVVTKSCRIVIPKDRVFRDAGEDGVIRVEASDITIEFAPGSLLRGADAKTRPDEYRGCGIRINGRKNVTLRNAAVHRFWCGIHATGADGLTLENIDASDMRRAYLKSTPVAEDGGDWLWPHNNDAQEWRKNYGASICIENTKKATVSDCKVWHSQNALILDRVSESKVFDNDFSFNSAWGIAMWRSCRNVISRNALDFNVRGYSHMVYNRGQDSAGLLVFEQNNENVFAENSVTHGGDGFFGFAGREALGQAPPPTPDFDYKRRGNNDNLLVHNDFSYAPAHGIEMTFSFGNRYIGNRLVGNAICGVWGGYSQDTLIAGNTFENNGEMGYGLERGGVNIEHGRGNKVVHNKFRENKCGVHYWWNPNAELMKNPWGLANEPVSKDNLIAANEFYGDQLAFHFRGPTEVTLGPNKIDNCKKELDAAAEATVTRDEKVKVEPFAEPKYPVFGKKRPVGARKLLYGRENIIMTEWGPWDHSSPLVRAAEAGGLSRAYEFFKMPGAPAVELDGKGLTAKTIPSVKAGGPTRYEISAAGPGVYPYSFVVKAGEFSKTVEGTILAIEWDAVFFKWEVDPRENLDGWRKLAESPGAVKTKLDRMTLKYAFGGPSDQKVSDALTSAKLGGDHFGMIARAKLSLGPGTWKLSTTSDDGIRVVVDGKPVIEDWTWHPPKRNDGQFTLSERKTIEMVVEHFEIDGYSTLEFDLSKGE